MTKSPFNRTGEGTRQCSSTMELRGRMRRCANDASHPDGDGIRWWCDEHRPGRAKTKTFPGTSEASFLGESIVTSPADDSLEIVLERAQRTLNTIAGMQPVGWENRPAAAYEALIDEMCSLAKSTAEWIAREKETAVRR